MKTLIASFIIYLIARPYATAELMDWHNYIWLAVAIIAGCAVAVSAGVVVFNIIDWVIYG